MSEVNFSPCAFSCCLCLSLQGLPERPAGLHTSLRCVAFVEWKVVNILQGNWSFVKHVCLSPNSVSHFFLGFFWLGGGGI